MASYAWTVTEDYIHDSTPLERWGKDSVTVNVSGPHDVTDAQLQKVKTEGWAFAMYDGDGILYYRGKCWSEDGYGSDDMFGPLDDYGKPNAGAVTIKYQNPETGKWEEL